jgi:isopenicillin-N epimerase
MQDYNWSQVSEYYRSMTQDNAQPFCELLDAEPLAPVNDDFIVQLYSAQIKTSEPEKLHDHFFNEYKIQIPVMRQNGKVYLRYSLNAFNIQADLDNLYDAIRAIKKNTNLIEA